MTIESLEFEIPDQEKEILLCYIERERSLWLIAKARDERAAHMSPEARKDRGHAMNKINSMLETLFDDFLKVDDGKR